MKRCPICKSKFKAVRDELHSWIGDECPFGHIVIVSHRDGEYIRIGSNIMYDYYTGSMRNIRVQNKLIERWIKRDRKRYLKGLL